MGPGVVSISIYFMIFPILPPFNTKILPFCGLWEENPTTSNTPCLCWKKRRLAFVAMCFIFLTSSLGTTARDGSGARRLFSVISEHPWIMCHGRHGPSITNQPTNQASKQASKHHVWMIIPLSIWCLSSTLMGSNSNLLMVLSQFGNDFLFYPHGGFLNCWIPKPIGSIILDDLRVPQI